MTNDRIEFLEATWREIKALDDRCPTCGGTKEEPRRRYDETKWWQATPLPPCNDPFHGKAEG